MNLSVICSRVREISEESGAYIRDHLNKLSGESIEKKGVNDFVTEVDKTSEKMLIHSLRKVLPGAGFIVEEAGTIERSDQYNWIIDPLDGTTNFIHGLPPHSVSVALMDQNRVILGMVLEVVSRECFYAWKDSPAYLNNAEIKVSGAQALKDSLVATGFPFTDFSRLEPYLETIKQILHNTQGIRRFGSAAVDLAYIACGRFDAFFEYNLKPWDVAAGAFIIQQAGGLVTDFSKEDNFIFGKELITANKHIFDDFYKVVHDGMTGK